MSESVTVVQCSVVEFDGERDFGPRDFVVVPRVGETVELWRDLEQEVVAKVVEVRHVEFDAEAGGDIVLYVEVAK